MFILQSEGPFPTNGMGRQLDFRPRLGLVDCQTSLRTADNPLKDARTMAGYRRHPTTNCNEWKGTSNGNMELGIQDLWVTRTNDEMELDLGGEPWTLRYMSSNRLIAAQLDASNTTRLFLWLVSFHSGAIIEARGHPSSLGNLSVLWTKPTVQHNSSSRPVIIFNVQCLGLASRSSTYVRIIKVSIYQLLSLIIYSGFHIIQLSNICTTLSSVLGLKASRKLSRSGQPE